jgi:hypothetical protein
MDPLVFWLVLVLSIVALIGMTLRAMGIRTPSARARRRRGWRRFGQDFDDID